MKSNYNSIAWFYDRLARLAYGKTLIDAQRYLITAIPPGADILIIGGGTGWILEEIAAIHHSGLSITYVDSSSQMVALAQKRKYGENDVTFIADTIETAAVTGFFDVALTPFFFDNFTDTSTQNIFNRIGKHIKPHGLWLYCDFQNTGISWQRALLKVMYLFFRVTCGIEARKLPDVKKCFGEHHFKLSGRKRFMNGFIVAEIYKREYLLLM